mgnify:CR=1 FL=1
MKYLLEILSEVLRRFIAMPAALLHLMRMMGSRFPDMTRAIAAVLQGIAVSAGGVRLAGYLIDHPLIKILLIIIIPLPVVGMALVLAFYGPQSPSNPVLEGQAPETHIGAFLLGTIIYVVCMAVLGLGRLAYRRQKPDDDP